MLAETEAAGVVIGLTDLDYDYGDAIGGLAWPLFSAELQSFRPAAIIAGGDTAKNLEPLLGPNSFLGVAGVKLVGTRDEALEHLVATLDRRAAERESKPLSQIPGQPALSRDEKRSKTLDPISIRIADAVTEFMERVAELSSTAGPISLRIDAHREGDSRWWSFYLINDGDAPLASAVLEEVSYEWGDQYLETKTPAMRITNLAPGARTLIWRDDGSSETRIDLWFRVRHGSVRRRRLLFSFPKLYRQQGNHLTARGELY